MDQILHTIIFLLNLSLKESHALLNFNYTLKFLKEFKVKHPFIIHTENYVHTKLIKNLFKDGQYSGNIEKIQDNLEFSM